MNSLRRWLYRPKRSDQSLLAQFYFADEELNHVAAELDSFEGRGDPERCAALVNQLRSCQARVLNVVSQMMDESIKDQRALRDFRVKFPDDLCQENLAGQLWFGAECLAAGSSIMNKEVESACMRPLARALTKNLDSLRTILREQCLQNVNEYTELITESLIIFDKLFAEFELSYVSAMAPVKTAHEYDMIQEITVLFSETVQRALQIGLLSQDMIDEYDPALMFTIPRLAIVCGTLIFKDGPLNPDNEARNISEMFRPFQTLLHKIRELLSILTSDELNTLERALCSQEEPSFLVSLEEKRKKAREERRRNRKVKKSAGKAKKRIETQEEDNGSIESELTAREIAERLEALALNFEASRNNSDIGATGVAGTNVVEVHHQNGEENSLSSSPLSCSVADSECVKNKPILLNSSTQEGDTRPIVDNDIDCAHKEDLQNDMSALLGNPCTDIPDSSMSDQADDRSGHLSPISHVKCENSSALNNDDDDDLEEERSINKRTIAHSGEPGQYELNKCDSNDSGLHSEVMSNSGSMFTISSSDSNQQITTSESASHIADQTTTEGASLEVCSADCKENICEDINAAVLQRSCEDDIHITNVDSSDASCQSHETKEDSGREHLALTSSSGTKDDTPSLCTQKSENNLLSFPVDESDPCIAENSGNLLTSDIEIEDKTADSVSNDLQELSCEEQSTEHLQKSALECDNVTDSHACAAISSNEMSCELIHSSDNSIAANDSCDITITLVDQIEDCAKNSEDERKNALSETSTTYKARTNVALSDSDSNSDAHSLEVENVQCNETDQQNNHSRLYSEQTLPQNQTLADANSGHIDTFSHLSNEGSSLPVISNTDTNNGLSKQVGKCQTSNPGASSKTSEGTDKPSAHSSLHASSSSSSTHRQIKNSSRRTHHRSQNRSGACSKEEKSKFCAAHAKMMLHTGQLDSDCYNSSETSSYTSDCGDQEEIALAIEAAENASRDNVRARFKSNSDMIHRLFVCISGVADQLQTNFAGDLRNILRSVFDMNCSEPADKGDSDKPKDSTPLVAAYRAMSNATRASRHRHSSLRRQDPPVWLADEECNECMACKVPFTFVRRRHHCRNCGKIYCGRCSSNYVPLPQFGQDKAVRVCNRCFMFQVTPFH